MRAADLFLCVVLFTLIAAAEDPTQARDEVSADCDTQTVVESVALPVYPGARKGAEDSSRLPIAVSDVDIASLETFETRDSAARVLEFYRGELAHHGEVLECRSGKAINPSALRRGLGCDRKQSRDSVVLKSGSSRNLFAVIVDFGHKKTLFTLIRALSSKDVGLARR
jgi:hypothetical protein